MPATDLQRRHVPVVALIDDPPLQLFGPNTATLALDDNVPFQTETSQDAQENFS